VEVAKALGGSFKLVMLAPREMTQPTGMAGVADPLETRLSPTLSCHIWSL